MKQSLCAITSNVEISPGIHLMWLEAPDIAAIAQPGQFITVRCEGLALRRPFSIHQVVIASEAKQSQVAILFKVVGKGTIWLSQHQGGDKVDIFGPLGNGFSVKPSSGNLLLVAGGIGIAPLVFLAQSASPQHSITLIYGASTARELYAFSSLPLTFNSPLSKGEGKRRCEERSNLLSFPDSVRFIPVTEDGSMGKKGVVTDILPDFLGWADQIYACGPIDMYKAMANMSLRAKRSNLKVKKCQVSLEVRMGCGIGACYGCTINTRKGPKKVCHDGPVFELDDILWEEVSI